MYVGPGRNLEVIRSGRSGVTEEAERPMYKGLENIRKLLEARRKAQGLPPPVQPPPDNSPAPALTTPPRGFQMTSSDIYGSRPPQGGGMMGFSFAPMQQRQQPPVASFGMIQPQAQGYSALGTMQRPPVSSIFARYFGG